ncbi:hypothetical protein Glove_476g49 [Diversispora epigaea]|uniref:Uncharacterized protein n=1 Tax=Diversispora epigaea TaxID=1348612 RepID=A0A397GL47_9GLOM|nr:hypothetical protein Glove_476g49 [Diversispora epigaea]
MPKKTNLSDHSDWLLDDLDKLLTDIYYTSQLDSGAVSAKDNCQSILLYLFTPPRHIRNGFKLNVNQITSGRQKSQYSRRTAKIKKHYEPIRDIRSPKASTA